MKFLGFSQKIKQEKRNSGDFFLYKQGEKQTLGLFPRKIQPRNETLGTFPTKSNPRSEVFWDSSPENERERGVSGIFPGKTRRIPNFPALFPPKRAETRSSRGFLAPDPTKIPFPFPSLSPPPPRGGFASSRWENSPFSAPKSPFFAPNAAGAGPGRCRRRSRSFPGVFSRPFPGGSGAFPAPFPGFLPQIRRRGGRGRSSERGRGGRASKGSGGARICVDLHKFAWIYINQRPRAIKEQRELMN